MAEKSRLDMVMRATAIATLISTIIGIAISVHQLHETMTAARGTLSALKLQALQQVTGFLDNNSAVRQELAGYLRNQWKTDETLVKQRIDSGDSGEELYYSKDLEAYRKATAHYERLGSVIDLGYLDFDIVFDVIAFPDQFWSKTATTRNLLRDNWGGKGQALPDFQSAFRRLCGRYYAERKRLNYASATQMKCSL